MGARTEPTHCHPKITEALSVNNMYQARACCGPSARPGAERWKEKKYKKPAFKEGLTQDKRGRKQLHSFDEAVLTVCVIKSSENKEVSGGEEGLGKRTGRS